MANTTLTTEQNRTTNPAPSADAWGEIVLIPAKLSAAVAFESLTVRQLCGLEKGSVLATAHAAGTPVPVSVAGVFIGWGEFQVLSEKLAIRIAEIV